MVKLVSNEILSSKEAIIPILNIFLFKREGRGRVSMEGKREGARQIEKSKRKFEHVCVCILDRNEILYLGVNGSNSLGVA